MKNLLYSLLITPSLSYAFCFEEAAAFYGVNPTLLKSIAMVESSLNPDAFNENKNKLGIVVSQDFGLMQINSQWFSKLSEFNVNEINVYEPCFNVSLGSWVLSSNFASHGFNWNSVGAYNAGFSPNKQKARDVYIAKVKFYFYQ